MPHDIFALFGFVIGVIILDCMAVLIVCLFIGGGFSFFAVCFTMLRRSLMMLKRSMWYDWE